MRFGKPYVETYIDKDLFVREFKEEYINDTKELVWHRDKRDRHIKVLESNNCYLQLDNKLPMGLTKGSIFYIDKMVYHRLLVKRGFYLKIEIKEL